MTALSEPMISAAPDENARPSRDHRVLRERGSLFGLLGVTALLYLWNLGASGYANDFYAAAVQAGTKSWKAFFFGSFDSANLITVDKPPAALWPMELSGRLFGFNSWSMLAPQAIEGVLAVWLLHATVKRWFGHWAGILAGGLLAITPVAVLMFRFNNPDALMVLLIVAAAYCTTRAIEVASTKWLVFAGLVVGLSFLAKGLQPFTVVPALGIAYLVAAPASWRRKAAQLLAAVAGIVVGAGWWVLAVQLTPAADRPYIGGSGDNSPLGLAFGYNGLSRLSGSSGGGPGGAGGGFDGATGIGRLFNSDNGGQIAWLIPAALIAIVALAVVTRRAALTDRTRAAVIIWAGWLLVTGAVLSFAGGVIHTYYTVELAPAIAALVGIGAVTLWRRRADAPARVALAAGTLVTGGWGYTLLHRTPSFYGWLSYLLLIAGIAGAALLLAPPAAIRRGLTMTALSVGLVVAGGASAAYALDTTTTPHTGSTPTAGPAVAGAGFGGRGGFGAGRGRGGFGGGELPAGFPAGFPAGGFPGAGNGAGGFPGAPSQGGALPGGTTQGGTGTAPGGTSTQGGGATGGDATGDATGGATGGGGLGASTSSALIAALKSTTTKWAAATIGSQSAGPLELASGTAVMAIGGFTGSDNAPTLAQFEQYVQAGQVRYFIASGGGVGGGFGGGGRGGGAGSAITSWVEAHYTATTIGGSTVYDLTKAKAS
ncbi:ArnT family glycosyltransferase [uncultured Jatrophihabitans sp.]|uniref:ArnT family glycosyltransferase n=1 Tax=uncultured Jatrophihabitans sp. TaxID=1610747 RepID=UPI0035C97AA8